MRPFARLSVFAVLVLVIASIAAPAFGAPSAWRFVDVTLQYENRSLLLVGGELPEEILLPYEAELAVPAGSMLLWIGEVLGGPLADDPELVYEKRTEGGLDIYRFTLTQSRVAQVEVALSGVNSFDGVTYTSSLAWTAWQDLPEVRIAHRIPRGAQITQTAEGASMLAGDEQFSYYAKTASNVKAGDAIDLSFAYQAGAPGAGSAAANSNTIAYVIVAGAAVILIGLLIFALRRRPAAASEDPAEDSESEEPMAKQAAPVAAKKKKSAPEPQPAPSGGLNPKAVLIGVGALVAVAIMVAVGSGMGAKPSGGLFTKDFGAVSACQTTELALTPAAGVDLEAEGAAIIDAFVGQRGIGIVSLDAATGRMSVEFCTSDQTLETLAQIVSSTGLVNASLGTPPSVPATTTVQ
ncbi:MAG: hypothetical protein ACYCXZ_03835 [Coriobacteriia bacterium]